MGWKVSSAAASMGQPLNACRTTHPVVDSDGRVIGLLAGHPKDTAGWMRISREAAGAIENARAKCVFTPEQKHHRRGASPALAFGISHGNGTLVSLYSSPPKSTHSTCMG